MLRLLALLLLLANLGWFFWHGGTSGDYLRQTDERHEPQRLNRQVDPDRVRVLPPPGAGSDVARASREPAPPRASAPEGLAASSAETVASAAAEPAVSCLVAGPLDDAEATAASGLLRTAGVAPGSWLDTRRERPAVWMIYLGPFSDRTRMRERLVTLQNAQIDAVESPDVPAALEPGLVLGRYATRDEARAQNLELIRQGIVRTARVLQLSPEDGEHRLRFEALDPEQRAILLAIDAPPLAGRWSDCPSR